MKIRPANIIIPTLIILSFALAIYFYPQMPDKMAFHWNVKNEVNSYTSRFWALFMMPLLSVGLYILFIILPMIDPKRENIEEFRKYYDRFMMVFFLFMFYIFSLTLIWNKGTTFNMAQFIVPAFGVLFIYVGILVKHAKQNWFIGIRTPWTLSNKVVWDKTHKIGGILFMIAGIICFFAALVPEIAYYLVLGPIILIFIFVIVYSYIEFRKQTKKTKV